MTTMLVVAKPGPRRDRWITWLAAHGFTIVEAPSLLQAMSVLDDREPAVLVYEPLAAGDQTVLAALSNVRDLPPVVMIADAVMPVSTRIPALWQLRGDADLAQLVAGVEIFARCSAVAPTRLPFRLGGPIDAHWTVRLRARVEPGVGFDHPDDGFDGATHPDGYAVA